MNDVDELIETTGYPIELAIHEIAILQDLDGMEISPSGHENGGARLILRLLKYKKEISAFHYNQELLEVGLQASEAAANIDCLRDGSIQVSEGYRVDDVIQKEQSKLDDALSIETQVVEEWRREQELNDIERIKAIGNEYPFLTAYVSEAQILKMSEI